MSVRRVRTACNRDCPDACGVIATVEDGRVVRLEGDPDHPVTKGFLCYRTNRFLSRQYDPSRLTTPLRRRGDGFEPIGWDEALDEIAAAMVRIRDESGPAAIFNYRSGGSLGLMKHVVDAYFERFGPVSIKSGDICSGAGDAAQETDFGDEDANDLDDLLEARTILLWGKNAHVSSVHLIPVLQRARRDGARVVAIDPVRHRGVELADESLQPRPGGDIALALGIARELFDNGRTHPDAASWCDHLDAFRDECLRRSVAEWAALADVDADALRRVAALYADGPSTILVGWGMQRRTNGSATVRTLDALGAVSGNIGVPGAGVSFYFKRRGAFDLSFTRGLAVAPRSIPEPLLGPGLLAADDPPVRMLWIGCGNPVAMLPQSDTVAQALRTRELTVVVDAFMTDSAREADLVLPTTTMLEDDDLVGAYGHHYLAEVRPVVAPPDGVKTDHEIVRALARRTGLAGEFDVDASVWKRRLLSRVAPRGATLEALREGAVRNPEAPRIAFAGRRFATASGRANLVHGLDPEPPRPTAERPFLLMALSTRRAQASQWAGEPPAGPPAVTVHPDAVPGLAAGAAVIVESAIGRLTATLVHDADQRTDVALMAKGGWRGSGQCANTLVAARTTDAGGGAVYYDTPVSIRPA